MRVLPKPKLPTEFVQFCNALRCPLCGSQLDGNIHPKRANLYCVEDNTEYRCVWIYGDKEPQFEQIIHYAFEYEYEFLFQRNGTERQTVLTRYYRNVNQNYRNAGKQAMMNIEAHIPLGFRRRLTEQEVSDRLKMYMVFT